MSSPIPSHAKHIVLTGGPCAGKTTALAYLYDHLTARGWRVIVVPEAATIVLGAAGRLETERTAQFFAAAQTAVLTIQRDLWRTLGGVLAGDEERVVFLYDRAELDNRAYVPGDAFDQLVEATHGATTWEVGQRYDAVLHLVTAADGAPEAYTLANNEARSESPEQARALDEATQQAWLGHSHYTVIPNSGSFEAKLARTLAAVLHTLGEPEPVEVERKWVLATPPRLDSLNATPVHITQHYLVSPAHEPTCEVRVRARTVDGHTTYYRTVKRPTEDPARRIEHEAVIAGETYQQLMAYQKPGTRAVRKTRWSFVENGQHFELDHITSPVNLWVLEAELAEPDQEVQPPASLGELQEVTGDRAYSNATLAGL